jgi:anti-anti-sigma regulatory factor
VTLLAPVLSNGPSTVQPLFVPELITLPAEIDVTSAAEVGSMIGAVSRSGAAVVIADLTGTVFCDRAGARELLRAAKRAQESHAELRWSSGIVLP